MVQPPGGLGGCQDAEYQQRGRRAGLQGAEAVHSAMLTPQSRTSSFAQVHRLLRTMWNTACRGGKLQVQCWTEITKGSLAQREGVICKVIVQNLQSPICITPLISGDRNLQLRRCTTTEYPRYTSARRRRSAWLQTNGGTRLPNFPAAIISPQRWKRNQGCRPRVTHPNHMPAASCNRTPYDHANCA